MRISTYNIWNSDRGMPDRFIQILEETKANKAVILCLQEVANEDIFKKLAKTGDYPHCHYYENNDLAIVIR